MAVELSIVIPTYKEKDNIRPLLDKISAALKGVDWEAIFVDDDSPDGTSEVVRDIAQHNPRVRCLQRIGRRGLSSASIEGMLSSAAPYLAVMDADLQHDASLLPQMLYALKAGEFDLIIGSRYVEGGSVGQWIWHRAMMSRLATWVSRMAAGADLKDPMSGYFMVERKFFHQVVRRLSGKGFKILLDIYASSLIPVRFKEISFQFGQRLSGESKLNASVIFDSATMVMTKSFGRIFRCKS